MPEPFVRPVIFSAPMVRAIAEGRKTQTRRIPTGMWKKLFDAHRAGGECWLWVRESFRLRADQNNKPPSEDWWKSGAWYFADDPELEPSGCGGGAGRLRPSIHMPRWASRFALRVTDIGFEPLQSITNAECRVEGYLPAELGLDRPELHPHDWFATLWNSLHKKPGTRWLDNPEIIAITFDPVPGNIDDVALDQREGITP